MAAEAIGLGGTEEMAGVGVSRGEDVRVIVDAALGQPGRARGVGDHGHLVPRCVGRVEALGLPVHEGAERDVAAGGLAGDDQLREMRDLALRPLELLAKPAPDHCGRGARVARDGGELPRPEHGHGGHGHDADLLAGEPGQDELRDIGHSQQDAVAAVEALGPEAVGQAIDLFLQLGVGDHAVAGAGLACAPGLGPIVVMAIGRLAVHNRVDTGLAHVLGVLAGHRHKGVASLAHLLADAQCGDQIRRFLGLDLVGAIGAVNLEHLRCFSKVVVTAVRRKMSGSN